MIIKVTDCVENDFVRKEELKAYTEDGIPMSRAGFDDIDTRFCDTYIKALLVGGVGTEPQYRRDGCVRKMIEDALPRAKERGCAVSLLHPFSFSYYRKFGYEKVADHKILEFPMSALEFAPRCNDFKPYDSEGMLHDLIKLYDKFSARRNITIRRYDKQRFSAIFGENKRFTYIRYDNAGNAVAYLTLGIEDYEAVNRTEGVFLHIYEMVFSDRESFMDIFGFMRMYEGQLANVKIHNVSMMPEVDLILRHYSHTKYTLIPDIMARVLNVKLMLDANIYPKERGHFVIRAEDPIMGLAKGVFEVEYENFRGTVKQLDDDAAYDISSEPEALAQIFYGYDSFNKDTAPYFKNVKLITDNTDIFRAFPKRNCGLFEHF